MQLVHHEIADHVAVVSLDDPERRNALSPQMVNEVCELFDALEADGTTRAVVVTGRGPAFCAGADLSELGASTEDGLRSIYRGFLRVAACTLPTVAAVNGPAVGAGMNLALACDVRVAAGKARFDTRFLQLGIHPGGGHTWMLRRAVGPQATAATVLFGEVLDGAEAERRGLVWRCVGDEDVVEEGRRLALRAAAAPPELARKAKATIAAMATIAAHDQAVERELEPQVWSMAQPDFKDRLAAARNRTPR